MEKTEKKLMIHQLVLLKEKIWLESGTPWTLTHRYVLIKELIGFINGKISKAG